MVTCGIERIREVLKDAGPLMPDRRGFPVHQFGRVDDCTAERVPDGLVTEAHAERRDRRAECPYELDADPCILGPSGARRKENAVRLQPADLIKGDPVVAHDANILRRQPDELDKVVRERIVVVDDENHLPISSAMCRASTRARDLLTVARNSFSGTESAT